MEEKTLMVEQLVIQKKYVMNFMINYAIPFHQKISLLVFIQIYVIMI